MAILDLFNFNFKKNNSLKKLKKNGNEQQNNENLAGLLNVREQNTNEMFGSIAKYTTLRNELIKKSVIEKNDITKEEAMAIIQDFFENISEQLPQGIIIPIKTSFVYNGKEQILLIGKNIMTVGKFLKANSSKPRHGMKGKEFVAFFIDNNEEFDLFDQTKNTRIQLSPETRPKIINLVNESIIDSKTMQFRVSNIEFSFKDWERSLESIVQPINDSYLRYEILDYLVSLDFEVTTGITQYLNNETEKLEIIEQEEIEENSLENIDTEETQEIAERM